MADLSDVESALVDTIAAAIYPNGTVSPSALPAAVAVRTYRGSPNASKLSLDMTASIPNISVFSLPGFTRETTRYPEDWEMLKLPVTTIAASVVGNHVTFSGTSGVPQFAGIRSGGIPYVYAATPADTPNTVAAALAALVPGATCAGAVVSVPPAPKLTARVLGFSTLGRELRRQKQGMKITFYAPTPALRDTVAAFVDVALSRVRFLALPDGYCGRLRYSGTFVDDVPQKEGLWKRDLRYTVDYPTTEIVVAPPMLWGVVQQAYDVPVSDAAI